MFGYGGECGGREEMLLSIEFGGTVGSGGVKFELVAGEGEKDAAVGLKRFDCCCCCCWVGWGGGWNGPLCCVMLVPAFKGHDLTYVSLRATSLPSNLSLNATRASSNLGLFLIPFRAPSLHPCSSSSSPSSRRRSRSRILS